MFESRGRGKLVNAEEKIPLTAVQFAVGCGCWWSKVVQSGLIRTVGKRQQNRPTLTA